MRRVLPLLLASCAAASCSPAEKPVDERALPIVGGTVDTGHPAVVAITYLGGSFCTGTLVAPRVVITAAHCIDPDMTMGIPVEDMDVFFGTDTQAGGTSIHLVEGHMHPDWSSASLANDIACVTLAGPAAVDPAKMNTKTMNNGDSGKIVTLVGFGVTAASGGGGGTKRQALSMITSVDGTSFTYGGTPGQTCFGDSGGPGFIDNDDGDEVFAGVTSAGDENCLVFGIDTRVDAYMDDFIQPCIDAVSGPDCSADGVCTGGCSPPDPDCSTDPCRDDGVCKVDCPMRDPNCFCFDGDGFCDLGCPEVDGDCTGDIPMGQPCGNDRECATGLCIHSVDDVDFRYCTRSCPTANVCEGIMGIGGARMPCTPTENPDLSVCAYASPSPGVTGAKCNSGDDCWSGLCLPVTGGATCGEGTTCNICTKPCLGELGGDCALGYSCGVTTVGAEDVHVCLPAPQLAGWCAAAPGGRAPVGTALVVILGAALAILARHGRKSERHTRQ